MIACNPISHITDSRFYARGYSTVEAKKVFCDLYRYQRWLDVEATLAEVQARMEIIPVKAAADIRTAADIKKLDLDSIKRDLRVTNHSLMPLLNAMSRLCPESSRGFIHFGATTQDIQDTAQVLEMKDIMTIAKRDLRLIIRHLARLAERYKDLVIIGRTHTQDALAMTLGLKMAVWLDELWRDLERILESEKRILVAQLFGGVGTMDSFGAKAVELLEDFSNRLGLGVPRTSWHNSRDRICEFLNIVALVTGALARIADEIRSLARSPIGEMEEPFHHGKLGSSTMPHKRNPEMCEQVVVLARLTKANAMLGFEGLVNEHERDYRAVRLEWVSVADSAQYLCAALSFMKDILSNLIVYEDRISQNALSAAPLICTEALMFYLGKKLGKDKAHTIIYEVAMRAVDTGQLLIDLLFELPEIRQNFSRSKIEALIDPSKHVGKSSFLTMNVVNDVLERLGGRDIEVERTCPLSGIDGSCSVCP